jgi:hypothetical protein
VATNPYAKVPRLPFSRHDEQTVEVVGYVPDHDVKPTHLDVKNDAGEVYRLPVTHLLLDKLVELICTYNREDPIGARIVVSSSANKNAYLVRKGADW